MGIYLVCLAWWWVLFLLPPCFAGCPRCGVWVCVGCFVFGVGLCCWRLVLLFGRRFVVCVDGCLVFESKRAERVR